MRAAALLALPCRREQSSGEAQPAAQQDLLRHAVAVESGEVRERRKQSARVAHQSGTHPHETPQSRPDLRIELQSRPVRDDVGPGGRGPNPSARERQRRPQPSAEYHRLEQGIAGETVGAVSPAARYLTAGPEAWKARVPIHTHGDATHVIVRRRHHRDRFMRRVDAMCLAQSAHLWECALVGRHDSRGIEPNAPSLRDVSPNGARDDVSGRKITVLMDVLHDALTPFVDECGASAPQCFGHERERVCRACERGGMKLHEFQRIEPRAGAQRHCQSIAARRYGIGRVKIELAEPSGREHRVVCA